MMKKIILIMSFFLYGNFGYGQLTASQTISSAGESNDGNGQLSWTIGEPISATLNSNENEIILTQGFHQPVVIINGIKDNLPNFSVSVFPNPSSEFLNIKFESIRNNISIEFYSTEGKMVFQEQILNSTSSKTNISSWSEGLYFLHIKENNQTLKSYRIIKL